MTQLRGILAARPGVVVAYVFGSRAGGRPRPDSDLDLAIAWDPELRSEERERAEQALRADLAEALGSLGERADLLDLRRAGSTVAFRAVRDGRLVALRDRSAKIELEAWIARRYDDEAPYRELFRRAAQRAGRRLGEQARGGS